MLQGGNGNDSMYGDSGNDRYIGFSASSGNDDYISDDSGYDRIEFSVNANIRISDVTFAVYQTYDVRLTLGSARIQIAGWYYDPPRAIEEFHFYYNGDRYRYTKAQIEGLLTGTNTGPWVNRGLPGQTLAIGAAWSMALPENLFSDAESQTSLVYSATQIDGSALPSWLTFNATTRTFSVRRRAVIQAP